jgi:integrase
MVYIKIGTSIFVREDGSMREESHQIRRLKTVCEVAKIEPAVSFHILRHTYGSLLASKGVPLQVIAELLGHSDTRITSRHYAHLMPSFVADTLRSNLPRFVKSNQSKVLRIDKVSGERG